MRAKTLEATLEKMLDDEERTGLVDQFYAHPLIKSLAPSGRLPSYIPKDQFAMAIHDMLTRNRALQAGNVLPVFRILMKEAGGDRSGLQEVRGKLVRREHGAGRRLVQSGRHSASSWRSGW